MAEYYTGSGNVVKNMLKHESLGAQSKTFIQCLGFKKGLEVVRFQFLDLSSKISYYDCIDKYDIWIFKSNPI